MKKLFLSLLFLSVLSFFSSCSKEEEVPTMDGTVWVHFDDDNYGDHSYDFIGTMAFDSSACTYTTSFFHLNLEYSTTYACTYNPPVVSMTSSGYGYADLRGTVTGDEMEVWNLSTGQSMGVFVKQ